MNNYESGNAQKATFLIDSEEKIPASLFIGYAFVGRDLIIEDEGRERYETKEHRKIEPGCDGSYITLQNFGKTIKIGTDYNGFCKLFIYSFGDYWAISNSFIELLRYVSKIGRPRTISLPHLSNFFIPKTLGSQLASLHTSIDQIKLVPSRVSIEIEYGDVGKKLSFVENSSNQASQQSEGKYRDLLRSYLAEATGRLAGLLNSDVRLICDITGGRDSRAVLALLRAAGRKIGNSRLEGVYFNSRRTAVKDFEIAERVSQAIGVPLGDPGGMPLNGNRLDSDQSYELWKSMFLGTYRLVFFPRHHRTSSVLWMGGEGGEAHRAFYSSQTVERLLSTAKRHFRDEGLFDVFRDDVLSDLKSLDFGDERGVDPVVAHYRNFRERFHAGRRSLALNAISPLSSVSLKMTSNSAGKERLDNGQVISDIIANTCPDLLMVPFDDEAKSFGPEHLQECSRIGDYLDDVTTVGSVFKGETKIPQRGDFSEKRVLALMQEEFLDLIDPARSLGIFGEDYIEDSKQRLAEAIERGRLASALDGGSIAHIIHAGNLVRLC